MVKCLHLYIGEMGLEVRCGREKIVNFYNKYFCIFNQMLEIFHKWFKVLDKENKSNKCHNSNPHKFSSLCFSYKVDVLEVW